MDEAQYQAILAAISSPNHTFTNASPDHQNWTVEDIKDIKKDWDAEVAVASFGQALRVVATIESCWCLVLLVAIKLHWEDRWEIDPIDGSLWRTDWVSSWAASALCYRMIRRHYRPSLPYGVRRKRAERVLEMHSTWLQERYRRT